MKRSRSDERPNLSREKIELAALALIEREGMQAFSTRKLAAELGCEAMSIYHHFKSKQHLLDALVDRVIGEAIPAPSAEAMRTRMRAAIKAFRATALRYPHFYQYLALHRLNTLVGLRMIDAVVGIFLEAGFDIETAARLFRVVGYYMGGAALEETAGYGKGHSAAEPVPDEIVIRDFPAVVAINPYFKPAQHEATFDLGLEILLDAVERMRPRAATRRRSAAAASRSRGESQD
jgi:AcrR family transcriptional regulator